jgi:NTP pyrophosphatase (non-canonical NTP hydrolase)
MKMRANDYQKAALRTASTLEPKDLVLNGALGLNGEAGEVADHIKKHLFQGHKLDKENLAKELGDICWYIAITAEGLGYDLATIMEMNIDKLKKRYPNGFEASRSLNREESK